MCGRFVSHIDAALEREFELDRRHWTPDWASYNVAPTQAVPVVRLNAETREGVMLRWGLVPFWAKSEVPKYATINARAETVQTAASYRGPWKRSQRCLIPADGYYEWRQEGNAKQPYLFRLSGGESFAFCGLWDRSQAADGQAVESCTIITVPANPMVAEIHHKARMPAMLSRNAGKDWLLADEAEAFALLRPFPANQMDRYAVSSRVGSPRNNDATLIQPLQRTEKDRR